MLTPTSDSARLFHFALPADWRSALAAGVYTVSTRGMGLDEVGFVHLAYAHQWAGVRQRFYADVSHDLLLLEIDPSRLTADVRAEAAGDADGELFPHLFGPLNVDAVVRTTALAAPHG